MNIVKKCISVFLAVSLLLTLFSLTVTAVGMFASGSGTENDPYIITTPTHLNNIRNYPDAHFRLEADIVFTDEHYAEGGEFYNYGYYWSPIGEFRGVLDGNGYGVYYLYSYAISQPEAGMFTINKGTIQNLLLYDCYVIGYHLYQTNTGAIAGENYGSIVNCTVSGVVYGESDSTTHTGGIVGFNMGMVVNCANYARVISDSAVKYDSLYSGGIAGFSEEEAMIVLSYNGGEIIGNTAGGIAGLNQGTVVACANEGEINTNAEYSSQYSGGVVGINDLQAMLGGCFNTAAVKAVSSSGDAYAGGIAAKNNNSFLSDCYNTGDIYAETANSGASFSSAGGIVGFNYHTTDSDSFLESVNACYNTGSVLSRRIEGSATTKAAAAIVGRNSGYVKNSYYLNNMSKGIDCCHTPSDSNGTVALSDEQMKNKASYKGFDFKDMWWMSSLSGYDYPQLSLFAQNGVKEIEIITPPTSTEIIEGGTPDLSGGKMKVTYYNEQTEELDTTELSVLDYDNTEIGTQEVVFVYGGYMFVGEITVIAKQPVDFSISTLPSKLTYVQGQSIDLSGSVLTVKYDNDTEENISADAVEIIYDKTALGQVKVTVKYEELTDSFNITVNERVITEVELYSVPDRVVYEQGSILNATGGVLKVYFESDDDYYELVDITADMLSGYDMNALGKQSVTVTYQGKNGSFDINVIESIPGDCDANGSINTTDLALLKKYLADSSNDSAYLVVNGNVDGEGGIDTTDLAILKKILANIY